MALIKCPECGNSVSDQAAQCIHCGYPFENLEPSKTYSVIVEKVSVWGDRISLESYIMKITGDDSFAAENRYNQMKKSPYVFASGLTEINAHRVKAKLLKCGCTVKVEEDNGYVEDTISENQINIFYAIADDQIRCPLCNSTQVTTGKRGYSLVWGFLGSGSTVNRCAKCGNKWKP